MSSTPTKQGFLLTRNSQDQLKTTELQFWISSEEGPGLLRIGQQTPVFFIKLSDSSIAKSALKQFGLKLEIKALELKTFAGETTCAVYSPTIHLHYRALDVLRDNDVEAFEGDIRLHERYLMERFVCAGIEFSGDAVQRQGYTEYQNVRIKPGNYKPNLKTLSIDIECDVTDELFSIGYSGCGVGHVHMIGPQQLQSADKEPTEIYWFDNERQLLEGFVKNINLLDPDVLIGWNLINFDLRILLQRAKKFDVKFNIGRNEQLATWRDLRGEKDKGFIWIPGRVAIDGIDALRTATYSFPSFSLENVARTLLGRGKKVEKDVDDRLAEIQHNFVHDKPQLAAYNLEDCRLVEDVFKHTQILDFLTLRSQLTGLEIDRAGGSVAAFTNLYLPRLHRGGYIAPNLPDAGGLGSPGGYVMDSRPGLYHNVLVLDFKSLYPSIIRTFKIDPMGMIEGFFNPQDSIEGFRGAKFDREKHFLPQIITDLWQQRDIAKKNKDAPASQAIKILMNSFYGVLGTGGCRFYDSRLTSSITMRGHEIMQTTQQWIEQAGFDVIYGDTDSIFVWIEQSKSKNECEKIGRELELEMNQRWQQHVRQEHDIECHLELEFETHFSRFLMPTIRGSEAGTKKRYAGLIETITEKGVKEQMIFKGLENVRTDWTDLAKQFQADLYYLIFHDQDPKQLIKTTVQETLAGKRDNDLVYRKQLRRKLDLYVKNVPPHVKAARLADDKNRKLGKRPRYQHKGWISYVLTTNGPEPLEYRDSSIDYQQYVDKQLKPVADAILPFIGLDFDSIISAQAEIF